MTIVELSPDFVIAVHDEIVADMGGLRGFAGGGIAGVEAALQRVANHAHYAGLNDILGTMLSRRLAQVFRDAAT